MGPLVYVLYPNSPMFPPPPPPFPSLTLSPMQSITRMGWHASLAWFTLSFPITPHSLAWFTLSFPIRLCDDTSPLSSFVWPSLSPPHEVIRDEFAIKCETSHIIYIIQGSLQKLEVGFHVSTLSLHATLTPHGPKQATQLLEIPFASNGWSLSSHGYY